MRRSYNESCQDSLLCKEYCYSIRWACSFRIRSNFPGQQQPRHFLAVVLDAVRMSNWFWKIDRNGNPFISQSFLSQHSFGYTNIRFLYCEKEERAEYSISFWITPFNNFVWLLLGLSVLALYMSVLLSGHSLDVFGILMRQACLTLNRNKVLIIFIFASIVFFAGLRRGDLEFRYFTLTAAVRSPKVSGSGGQGLQVTWIWKEDNRAVAHILLHLARKENVSLSGLMSSVASVQGAFSTIRQLKGRVVLCNYSMPVFTNQLLAL